MQPIDPEQDRARHPLVSIVILSRNPSRQLLRSIASAKQQVHKPIEIILVQHGDPADKEKESLREAASLVSKYVELSGATGVSIGDYFVVLHAGDELNPNYVTECLRVLNSNSDLGFVYSDYRLSGRVLRRYYKEADYNLYELLDHDLMPRTAVIRKLDWVNSGSYAEWSTDDYTSWEFGLRLAAQNRFGHRVPKPLITYRSRKSETTFHLQHPELYSYAARSEIKRRWAPAVSVMGTAPNQIIVDCDSVDSVDPIEICEYSRAPAFVICADAAVDSHDAESAALAVWGGQNCIALPDGSIAASRRALLKTDRIGSLQPEKLLTNSRSYASPRVPTVHTHLQNAGLLSMKTWMDHPVRSLVRLIPLRLKETVNRLASRDVFDLGFYVQFQPNVLVTRHNVRERLEYFPRAADRRRVALITPHLGSGGAEHVLLEIANSLDRSRYEISVIATRWHDIRWLSRWRESADHVYDLLSLVPADRVPLAIYSILTNWRHEFLIVQNSLPAYSVIPELKQALPDLKMMDIVHSVNDVWDIPARTLEVSRFLDTRIVISKTAGSELQRLGVESGRIRLIPNGIDLDRFRASSVNGSNHHRLLFAARLDAVKRPLLLVDIARELGRLRPTHDFRIVVAGDGPERQRLADEVNRSGVNALFEFLGEVPDLAPLLADCRLLIVTSENEGIPLVALEALACEKPVVASDVGAIHEVIIDGETGRLIDKGRAEIVDFARSVSELLDNAELRARMGSMGRRKVEAEFNRTLARNAYVSLFD